MRSGPGRTSSRSSYACSTAAVEPDPETRLAQLRGDDPAALETLVLLVTGAYYMHPKVRKLIGYPGQKATPEYPDEAEYYLSDGLLDPVLARGPIYRPTPLSPRP